jgi:hypothetical protein
MSFFPQDDTVFDMKNPDDLVGFLELEKKLNSIENLTKLMSKKNSLLSKLSEETHNHNSKFGNAVHNAECKSAIPIEDCNFYFSTTLVADDYK